MIHQASLLGDCEPLTIPKTYICDMDRLCDVFITSIMFSQKFYLLTEYCLTIIFTDYHNKVTWRHSKWILSNCEYRFFLRMLVCFKLIWSKFCLNAFFYFFCLIYLYRVNIPFRACPLQQMKTVRNIFQNIKWREKNTYMFFDKLVTYSWRGLWCHCRTNKI